MTELPTLAQLIKQAIDNRLFDVHTALIARVENYHVKKQLIDVSPVLARRYKNREGALIAEHMPMLCDVPVLFPRGGGYFISFPIQSGDFVQLIFNEAELDGWFDESEPAITHGQRFTLQGAVAIPGIFPASKVLVDAHETNFVLGREQGLQIHIDDQKIRLGSADATEALAIASKVREELDRIKEAFHKHTHMPAEGSIKLNDRIEISCNIAAQNVVTQ